MPTTLEKAGTLAGGAGRGPAWRDRDFGDDGRGGGGGRDDGRDRFERHRQICRTAIWVALAPIIMLFTAFASAYIVRRGIGHDWQPLAWPPILWLNTAVLLASSLALERARGFLRRGLASGFRQWWSVTTVLGVVFLAGQLVAWWQLVREGVYMASNPSAAFFYLLTAAHGLHLLGGLAGLGYVSFQTARAGIGPARHAAVEVSSIYWHFLGILWSTLFLMLIFWR